MRAATRLALVVALGAIVPGTALAQDAQQEGTNGGRLITPADIRAWNSIRQNVLSNDGKWFAYVVGPSEGDLTLILRGTAKDATETRIPVGDGGGSIALSGDSKWLGYIVAPPRPANGGRAGRGGRGGRGGGGRGAGSEGEQAADSSSERNANKLVLMNLATGEKKEIERIRRFSFNGEKPTWVAMQGYGADGAAPTGGGGGGRGGRGGGGAPAAGGAESGGNTDLLLYHIATGETFNMGRVGQFAFDESGDWLAYTMDTPDQVGNGLQLRNLKTNVVRSIESDRQLYRHLAWVDSSAALSVMRGRIDTQTRDTVFSIVAFTAFGANGPAKKLVFDPVGRTDFPSGWKLASERAPRYADDMSAVFFGIREVSRSPRGQTLAAGRGNSPIQPGAPGAGGTINQTGRGGRGGATADTANEQSSLILWHAKDPRLQSQQIVQEQQDRGFNYLAEYRFDDNRFVRLADDSLRDVTVFPRERFAYGTDNRAYQQEASYSGRNYQDIYSVDLRTGARKLLMKKKPGGGGGFSPSPDGRKALYWGTDGHYWVLDFATGESVNITKGVPASFVDTEDDHNNLYPPSIPSRGWAKDGSAVLLYDNWDVWKVPVKAGNAAVNLTGDGRKNQVRYQRIYPFATPGAPAGGGGRGGGGRGGGGAQEVDLSKPLYFGTYGEWTKKEGLARVDPGRPGANAIFFEDARFNITKARDAEVYTYTRQTFTEYPNHWVFGGGFKDGYRITDVNPQMKELAWSSGTRLIDYTSEKGDKLQGALYLPANYEPGKKYPLLVTIYEKRSQNKNGFVSPSETRAPDPALFTNRGYAVLDPDIVYRVNDPGMSAVWCVIPAVKAAIETGIIDEGNIGLWGHSWGGYQTAFLVTQTNIFKAAIAGAPLTDMVSMYSSVYWNTGGANQAIFESSQGRFKGNFIDNYDAYIRNSPAFHAKNVTTPLIILHNDKDGAVDFNQGITYFNTLRQLGKDVVMLEYVGENHGLQRPVNQRDYAARMTEWFDHHLKGVPAVDWIKNGVPRLRMEEHLRSRNDTTRVRTQ
jgi:dipeptidyl aminopeptidase/acylaminoacyl peptidase